MRIRVSALLLLGTCLVAGPLSASADDSVMGRSRPDYDAKGLPLGGFRMYPTLYTGIFSDSNIYRTETLEKNDTYFEIAPAVRLDSNWSRHGLSFMAGLQRYMYSTYSQEDRTDWNVGANGFLDVQMGVQLKGGANYNVLHEARTSPDTVGFAASPTQYSLTHGETAFVYNPYHFGIEVGGSIDKYKYKATPLLPSGSLDNSDRNHDVVIGYVKGSYEFSPGYSMFVRADYNTVNYELNILRAAGRDAKGYSVNGGLDMMVGNLIRGEMFVGYLKEDYAGALFTDVAGVSYGANLDWYATQLITVHLTASRKLNATTLAGASTSDDASVGIGADYELMRNVILTGNYEYTDSKFRGTTREDKVQNAGFGVKYLINRYLNLSANYAHGERDTSATGQDYSDDTISGGLTLQF